MEKLTKEDIYVPLEGKSKEELTEIQNVLIMFNEPTYRKDFKTYYNSDSYNYLEFSDGEWLGSRTISKNKQEVTIQQLKEILQPMENKEFDLTGYSVEVDNEEQAKQLQELAFKQGFTWRYNDKEIKLLDEKSFQFGYGGKKTITYYYNGKHYQDEFITKTAHFNDIFKETLEQQLEKAKAEVKRIEKEISKPKVGEWVVNKYGVLWRCSEVDSRHLLTKITDQELINKLNNLIK